MDKQLVEIPKYVADWIEKTKNELNLREAMSQGYAPHEVNRWLREMDQDGACLNQELFARAWLDGYKITEGAKYKVSMKGVSPNSCMLKYYHDTERWIMGTSIHFNDARVYHTKEELEAGGFSEVFNSPLFEVEEVTE